MTSIGHISFCFFLFLIVLTGTVFCLPYQYGWGWGLVIQFWAVFGFIRLYHLSEPVREDTPHKKLSMRLRDSLFRRTHAENEYVTGRLGRIDSFAVLIAGAMMGIWIASAAYLARDEADALSSVVYVGVYLIAQLFCFGVIAFLAQLYAALDRYVMAGFFACLALLATVLVYTLARYGFADEAISSSGLSLYFLNTDAISPFALRRAALGWGGAVLPWLAITPITLTLIGVLFHPARRKLITGLALGLVVMLAFYDLYAVRGPFHFLIVIPGWAALTLSWGRSGYGPLWTPWAISRHKRASRSLATLR